MTKSYPDPGRKPGGQSPRGRGNPPDRGGSSGGFRPMPDRDQVNEPGASNFGPAVRRPTTQPKSASYAKPGAGQSDNGYGQAQGDNQSQYQNQLQGQGQGENQAGQEYPRARIEPGKRVAALLIDVTAAYIISFLFGLTFFITRFVPPLIIMLLYLLTRDFWFCGRGIGKNLMGLQVVDASSGRPPLLIQSVLRNVVLLAPFLVIQVIPAVLKLVPLAWVNEAVMQLIDIVGMIYVAIVLPLESYRAYSREDSLRIGDELAGTMIIESEMDFSNPLSRQ